MNVFILLLSDLDMLLINSLDIENLYSIRLLNKHYLKIINEQTPLSQWMDLCNEYKQDDGLSLIFSKEECLLEFAVSKIEKFKEIETFDKFSDYEKIIKYIIKKNQHSIAGMSGLTFIMEIHDEFNDILKKLGLEEIIDIIKANHLSHKISWVPLIIGNYFLNDINNS